MGTGSARPGLIGVTTNIDGLDAVAVSYRPQESHIYASTALVELAE